MIYLIGGAPRVGKTTLARLILKRRGIPFMPADALTHAMDRAYPFLGVRAGEWEEIPERFYPYLRELVRCVGWGLEEYVIEGDSFFPEQVERLAAELPVRSVFLGTQRTSLAEIQGRVDFNDWIPTLPEEERARMPEWIERASGEFRRRAERWGLPYVELAGRREEGLEEAYRHLFG